MRLICGVALFSLLALGANAQVITSCGASAGHAYYLPNNNTKGEWLKDGLSQGALTLVDRGDKPQILYRDATKTMRDAETDDGAKVYWMSKTPDVKSVLVVHSAAVEHYLFKLDARGRGEVVWGTFRHAGMIKGSVFKAECSGP